MPGTAHPTNAADLLVHGTYPLRRAIRRLARPPSPPVDAGATSRDLVPEQPPADARLADPVAGRDRADDLALADRR